ncbi:hypothetical protein UF64_02935 [Thalassospira sp. HJ]|uniref:DUF4760 domain-containing protein n=1 Tax=Thalassospira sp. HJ TaxID=1616823 RepID=UPI0005CE32FF|nr:DUF4760 domain-containing protein [Thalassospira sp. HJ]KJE36651.1 hypothetical protein UF64_02935 [Thalassospira sp. HJ]
MIVVQIVFLLSVSIFFLYQFSFSEVLAFFVEQKLEAITAIVLLFIAPLSIVDIYERSTKNTRKRINSAKYISPIIIFLGVAGSIYVFENKTAFIACITASLATIGWLSQRQVALEISRKQHTLNVLTQMRHSEIFNKHRINIFSRYPHTHQIPDQDVSQIMDERLNKDNYSIGDDCDKIKFPLAESIIYVCNYYEFLASAIKEGDLDDALMRETLEDVFKSTYNKLSRIICTYRDSDNEAFENYYWLVEEHWNKKKKKNFLSVF